MTFGSLFSGVGGLDLGLERAGLRCVWQVENDDYARAVLEKHWPSVPKYRDVRFFLGSKRWRRCRAAWYADVIAGGFPCTDISYAGKMAGIEGDQSGLWREFTRIIRLLVPGMVIVENVPALLDSRGGFNTVLANLADCGFDAEWFCLPAQALGAPYIRDRVFIVGWRARPYAFNDRISGDEKGCRLCPETSCWRGQRSGLQTFCMMYPLPTLTANAGERGGRGDLHALMHGQSNRHMSKRLASLNARYHRSPNTNGNFTDQLPNQIGGTLNPTWCEWYQGFPTGWTELED